MFEVRRYFKGLAERLVFLAYSISWRLTGRKADTSMHGVNIPEATYQPWRADEKFMETLRAVRNHTMLDTYRLYELWSLTGQVARLGGDVLEVGVWRGGSGALLATRVRGLGIDAKVFLCDTFEGVPPAGSHDPVYRGGEHANTSPQLARSLMEALGLDNFEILQGDFPVDTAPRISTRRFSLCHVDVDTHESARSVTDWVWPRLIPGGCLVYDDYGFPAMAGVTRFVDDMFGDTDKLLVQNLNGHAVVIKTRDTE